MNKNPVNKSGKIELYVIEGDITQIPTDAIMTAINSGGMWFGGIDGAIQRAAGNRYHAQAGNAMPLRDLQVIVAKGDRENHRGKFNDVVFVVDDLRSSLDRVVYAGLEAAHRENYGQLLIPAMRRGVMAGAVEKTSKETIYKLKQGVDRFIHNYGDHTKLEHIIFVVYRDPGTVSQLTKGLGEVPFN